MRSVVCKAVPQIQETGRLGLFRSDRPDYEDGGQKRDFVYVKDCAALVCWFHEHGGVNGVFNVGTGQARSWNDLAAPSSLPWIARQISNTSTCPTR